jgi:hypothetical protein
MRYNPNNWYWKAADGRIFSSAAQAIVPADHGPYLTWLQANTPTQWPRDDEGNQTSASLQEVLAPYGMFADLKAYAASVRYSKETAGTSIGGVAYPSDRETQAKLTAAALFAQVDPTRTFQWKLADGTFTPSMSASQMVALASSVAAFVNSCFVAEASVIAGINAGTITTRAQVDAAFA